jgi:CHAD domain-containing protein
LRSDWRFNREISSAELAEHLPADLSLEQSETLQQTLWICDDFSRQIWQAGYLLVRCQSGELQLWQNEDRPLATSSAASRARFWWQLPKGELAARLKRLIDVRAFVPEKRLTLTTSRFNILNAEQKIVTRIRLFRIALSEKQACCLATILPLRGCEDDYRRSVAQLAALEAEAVAELTLRQLVLESGLPLDIPITKPEFQLQPEEPTEPAILRMARVLLRTARQYEAGMLADIDSEFVHQYRVNLRKTRSLLSLFRKSLAPRRYQLLKAELKTLANRTNLLRDLDVFLLGKGDYLQLLPEQLRPGLSQVFRRIRRRRTAALKRVTAALEQSDYEAQTDQIGRELGDEADLVGDQAGTPLKQLVCRKGLRLYRKIGREGQAINAETPDDTIHALRNSCKKLRYLLELFGELFAKAQLKYLVSALKKLQDNLGRFNDYAVQAAFLGGIGRGKITGTEAAGLNGLIAVLYQQQRRERSLLVENIAAFNAPPVSAQFLELFTEAEKP